MSRTAHARRHRFKREVRTSPKGVWVYGFRWRTPIKQKDVARFVAACVREARL